MGTRVTLGMLILTSVAWHPAIAAPPTFTNPLDITNPYQPFEPGGMKVFAGVSDGSRHVAVYTYLAATRTFMVNGTPVACRIIQKTEFEDGALGEFSQSFFAQADDGTVYYFGELVDKYENGRVASHEGSWLVGGATQPSDPPDTASASVPAVFMPPSPMVGDTFKPEDLLPIVDETLTVQAIGRRVRTAAGRFSNAIRVKETSRLPGPPGTKWYAAGVGAVKARDKGGRSALVASTLRPR
jgi:hypothetical protein